MIFNIVVDAVIRAVLDVVCVPKEPKHRLAWLTGERDNIF